MTEKYQVGSFTNLCQMEYLDVLFRLQTLAVG